MPEQWNLVFSLYLALLLTTCQFTRIHCNTSYATFNLTLLHNNDFHSRFAPTNVYGGPCSSKSASSCIAGAARTVQKVNDVIKEKGRENVVFLNAGDHFQGTAWYTLYKHKVVSDFVKLFKYDAMALGNHEFDDGPEGLAPFITAVNPLPILSCNLDIRNDIFLRGLNIQKSIVIEKGGHKIGIIGFTTPDTVSLSSPGIGVKFNDEIDCIRREVKKLLNMGISILVAVGHSGYTKDLEIAREIPELDIVVGGHSNTFLWSPTYEQPKPPSIEKPLDSYPVVIKHANGKKTLVVQAYAYGKYLGILDVGFDGQGNVMSYQGNPFLLDSNTAEDRQVKALVEHYSRKANVNGIVGQSRVLLDGDSCRKCECNLGNLIADSWVDRFVNQSRASPEGWTYFPIALINSGTIRASIDEVQHNGDISLEDLMTVMPFEHKIEAINLNGSELRATLEHGVSTFDPTGKRTDGHFLQMSGIKVVFDVTRETGHRIVSADVRCGHCRVPKFEPLDDGKIYQVLVTDYMANGGDGFTVMADANQRTQSPGFGVSDVSCLSRYFNKRSPVTSGIEGRITLLTGTNGTGPPLAINLALVLVVIFNLLQRLSTTKL